MLVYSKLTVCVLRQIRRSSKKKPSSLCRGTLLILIKVLFHIATILHSMCSKHLFFVSEPEFVMAKSIKGL